MAPAINPAQQPLQLPCGLTLKNRLIKSAMSEKMAARGHPTAQHQRAYERWARGGWAALITGNIMVDEMYCSAPGDVVVSNDEDERIVQSWIPWAEGVHEGGCRIIAQLNHPGRQSPLGAGKRPLWAKTLAPSAVPLNLGDSYLARAVCALVFGTPRAMTTREIEEVVGKFARAARLAAKAGFDGVEIHAGHGFLLSQFLSPASNRRTDAFGGSAANRAEFLLRVLRAVRQVVPASFCVGLKINAPDHMNSNDGFEDLLSQIEIIHQEAPPDYVQLTGGSFEDPKMLSTRNSLTDEETPGPSARTLARTGFFVAAGFAVRTRFPSLILMVTGGFRSRGAIETALCGAGNDAHTHAGACDLIGIARPAVRFPHLPDEIVFNEGVGDEAARFDVERAPATMLPQWVTGRLRSVGAGAETNYYASLIRNL